MSERNELNTLDLAHAAFGKQGPVVLILHGLFGSGRNWNSIARRLAEHYRVLTVDLRNHGDSPHDPEMDYPHLAADLVRLMDSRAIESAAVIGHSLGGKVAIWLAISAPARVNRLMAVDIAPVHYEHDFDPILSALAGLPLGQIQSRDQADETLSKSIAEPKFRQFLLQNLVSEHGHYRWRIDLDIFRKNIPALLGFPPLEKREPYYGEALFMLGARSRYVLPEHHEAISRYCPKHRILAIEDAGHWVQVDQPREFLKKAHEFLSSGLDIGNRPK